VFAILWHLSSVITYEQIAMSLTSKTLLLLTGGVCTLLGFVGLVIPLMPGFVFFAIAVLCFSSASPTLHRKLTAVPKIERFLQSVQDNHHMPVRRRVALGVKQAARLVTGDRHE
jgi:uncharacterized membrane protein YbaN (DUF454 family)